MPDASTLNRFNNKLEESGVRAVMFDEVERQVQEQGIQVRSAHGALVEIAFMRNKGE